MIKDAGYRELAHTADWELEAWAPDLTGLLEQAARGMYAISGTRLDAGERHTRSLDLRALDAEGLLVRFLTELLWLGQQDGLAFDTFLFTLSPGWSLQVALGGASIVSIEKDIKAVTYHNLVIRRLARGLAVNIVFDV
ncbi:MAG TPA: archease [Anaerolineales bacterium]|nr:archease [Anaerolineales bacterium]